MKGSIWAFMMVVFFINSDRIVFQSKPLRSLSLKDTEIRKHILDDYGEKIDLIAKKDSSGMIYWFRKLKTPVCLSGECKEISVGIYWYSNGKFLGLEVYNEELTKTDHSVFTNEDYNNLIEVLIDDWSVLREYEYDDLLNEEMEGVDGVTGATKKEIADGTVEGAVYTTYTLWHLIHVGEKDQIQSLTAQLLNTNKSLLNVFLKISNDDYKNFALELMIDGKLDPTESMTSLVFDYLTLKDDIYRRELAFKSLPYLDLEKPLVQVHLARAFSKLSSMGKMRIVNNLNEDIQLEDILYRSLVEELKYLDEWGAAKILNLVKKFQKQDSEVVKLANNLSTSSNNYVRKIAIEFLESNSSPD